MARTLESSGHARVPVRVPPNLFGIAFGLAGLGAAWTAAGRLAGPVVAGVGTGLFALAALVWIALVVAYLRQGPARVLADLRDPVLGAFVPVGAIAMLLPAAALTPVAPALAQVLVGVLLVVTAVLGGYLTGQWIVADRGPDAVHPGYFLPTIAGGLVAAIAAAQVGWDGIAAAALGIGLVCWVLLGSVVLNRLFVGAALPAPLLPTLAIEVAPPAVAGVAWFAVHGEQLDTVGLALGGYTLLMVLVQLRFAPLFRGLTFAPGFWAFTFSYAAVATDALLWLAALRPWGTPVWVALDLALITGFIGTIAARTVGLALRGSLFPHPPTTVRPLDDPDGSAGPEGVAQGGPGGDAELGEDPVEVRPDRAR